MISVHEDSKLLESSVASGGLYAKNINSMGLGSYEESMNSQEGIMSKQRPLMPAIPHDPSKGETVIEGGTTVVDQDYRANSNSELVNKRDAGTNFDKRTSSRASTKERREQSIKRHIRVNQNRNTSPTMILPKP